MDEIDEEDSNIMEDYVEDMDSIPYGEMVIFFI